MAKLLFFDSSLDTVEAPSDMPSGTDHTLEAVDHVSAGSRTLSALTKASLRKIGAEISESSLRDVNASNARLPQNRGHKGAGAESKRAETTPMGFRRVLSPALLCRESIVQLG